MTDQSLSLSIKALSVGMLHLDNRVHNALIRSETNTIGLLVDAISTDFVGIRNFGPAAIQNALHAISTLKASTRNDGEVDWLEYCSKLGIKIIPANKGQDRSPENILKELPNTIQDILCFEADDRRWRIIQRRFGLGGKERLTLDELGVAYGLTRERVRQIEKTALNELREVFVQSDYGGKKYHVHPDTASLIKAIFHEVASSVKDFVLETELFNIVKKATGTDSSSHAAVLSLLFHTFGMSRIHLESSDLVSVWEYMETQQRDIAEEVIQLIESLLSREKPSPMDEFDLLFNINRKLPKSKKLNALQLRKFVGLCSSAEITPSGLVQSKFEHIKGRGNQAERVLIEANKPLHIAEITREINKRFVAAGKGKIEQRTLANSLSPDERFVTIGRSGNWGLARWEHIDPSTIIELMEEYLISINRPATEEEIYAFVSTKRSVSINSVKIYLSSQSIFRKADRTKWGLATWTETQDAVTWKPQQVAGFVVDFFRKLKSNEVEFKVLRQALMKEADVSAKQAQGMLGVNPVITTRREAKPFKIIAVLNPEYKAGISPKTLPTRRKKETMLQKAERIVRQVLSAESNNQMELSKLVSILRREPGLAEKTAYQYISRMTFLEKIALPNSAIKICHLKGKPLPGFPQIAEVSILDPNKAAQASRAVEKLNIDDVDVGLFMLGRLFEDALKDFMIAVEAVKAYPVNAGNYSKLNNMIDWIKSQGIISESTTLHFLRQERNARAHDSPPALEERRLMLSSSPWVASMYLDYILFFAEKKRELLNTPPHST